MARSKVLVVDEEWSNRFRVRELLASRGYEVREAGTCDQAEEEFRASPPDAAIIQFPLPDGDAGVVLPRLRKVAPEVPFVVAAPATCIDAAAQAARQGAEQVLARPVEPAALVDNLERLTEHQRQASPADNARETRCTADPFLGTSASIRKLAHYADKVLASESPVLIQGETGSGKGVLARWLHEHGRHAGEAFVDLNCAGLTWEFLDTELFGHEKGAFTGAVNSKPGLFEVAHRGSVFLDEIGDADLRVQPKILKVLEEKRFRRLGDVRDREVNIRLIAATNRELCALVKEKSFRVDLYFRISTLSLRVPPLRERAEDIPALAGPILAGLAADAGRGELRIAPDALQALQSHPWPGNIRELRNVLERAMLLSKGHVIRRKDLRFDRATKAAAGAGTSAESHLTLAEVERMHIERVLCDVGGHVERAARRLGIPRSTLYHKIKLFGIARPARQVTVGPPLELTPAKWDEAGAG